LQFAIETCVYYLCCIAGAFQCFKVACWRFIVAGLPWNSYFKSLHRIWFRRRKILATNISGPIIYYARDARVRKSISTRRRRPSVRYTHASAILYYYNIIRRNTLNNIHSVHVLTLWCLNFDGVARTSAPCVYTKHIIIIK